MEETRYYLGLVFPHTQREWRSKYLSQEEVNDLAVTASRIPEIQIKSPFEGPQGLPKPTMITIYAENNNE